MGVFKTQTFLLRLSGGLLMTTLYGGAIPFVSAAQDLHKGQDFFGPPAAKEVPQEKEFFNVPQVTKIDPQFFVLPELPKVEEESKPEPEPFVVKIVPPPVEDKKENDVEPEPVRHHNSRESLVAQAAKLRLQQRRSLQEPLKVRKKDLPEQELVYNKDPHYRTWDQRVGEEKLTYPVDRDWVFTRNRMISGVLKTGIRSTIGGDVIMIVDREHFAAKGCMTLGDFPGRFAR